MDFYTKLAAQKSEWSVIETLGTGLKVGAEETIARALALRCLEIPVGEFVEQASKKELPLSDSGYVLLKSNIQDEEKHDRQLESLTKSIGLTTEEHAKKAEQFLRGWLDLDDHPLVKAMVIERSIFFVLLPILRNYGNSSARTVARDISGDEQVHVAFNTHVCKELGLTYSKKADRLRREIVAWFTAPLKVENDNRGMQFWMDQSTSLLEQGVAPELSFTRATTIVSFFEFANTRLTTYVNS